MFEERSSEWRAHGEAGGPNSCWAHCCRSPKSAIALTSSTVDYHRTFGPALVANHPTRSLRISPIKTELQDMTDLSQNKYNSSKMIEQFNCVEVASYRNHESLSESSVEKFLEKAHAVVSDGSEPEIDSGRGLMAEKETRSKVSMCFGCGSQIHDQYILRVSPDLEWHAACLKCADCQQFLDENNTCFVKDGKTYCRRDYVRLFGTKCDKCSMNFKKNDLVMRAKTKIYHMECFKCDACQKSLEPGQEFALRQDGLFCKEDHEELSSKSLNSENNNNNSITNNNNTTSNNNNTISNSNNNNNVHYHHHNHNEGSNSDSSESGSHKYSNREVSRSSGNKVASDGKPTRVRTVLNEKQLHTLRNCYAANPRPDALMKEQLVEMTGLSPRVIRVWFQNKRCKDKKRAIAMKQQMQHEKEGRKMGYGSMQGIPMVASSPVRHESPIGMNPIEVQSYPAPWKALSDFALHTDLDRLDPSTPHFQQLVNQMHGYDIHRSMGMQPHDVGHPPGPQAPGADMIHPDSTDSLVTYMDGSDESLQQDPGSP